MIFDTNFLIDLEEELERSEHGPARQFLDRHPGEPHAISIISVGEFVAGCADLDAARRFLTRFEWLALSRKAAVLGGLIDRQLITQGARLGENDTWIAATAQVNNRALVTRDTDFRRVRGLKVQAY